MKVQQLGPAPIDPTQEIVDQVLNAPLESVVIAKKGAHTTDVVLRTGSDGWLSTARGDAYGTRTGYWKADRVERWARDHLGAGATLHLINTQQA